MSFRELQEATGVLKSNLSQHLTVLITKGILIQRKEGLNAFYKLSTIKVAKACQIMREVLVEITIPIFMGLLFLGVLDPPQSELFCE